MVGATSGLGLPRPGFWPCDRALIEVVRKMLSQLDLYRWRSSKAATSIALEGTIVQYDQFDAMFRELLAAHVVVMPALLIAC
jgi:hypothetical protein